MGDEMGKSSDNCVVVPVLRFQSPEMQRTQSIFLLDEVLDNLILHSILLYNNRIDCDSVCRRLQFLSTALSWQYTSKVSLSHIETQDINVLMNEILVYIRLATFYLRANYSTMIREILILFVEDCLTQYQLDSGIRYISVILKL